MDKDDSQFKKGKASNIRRSFSRSFYVNASVEEEF